MSAPIGHCPPDCSCRGAQSTMSLPSGDPAILRALDLATEAVPFGRCFTHGGDDGCNVVGCAFRKQVVT